MQLAQQLKRQAFTLVEMLVALAVGAIVVMATYASYEMVNTQYQKNIDIANMHTSGRSIIQIIERDVRMAGFEYRYTSGTNKGKKAFASSITKPLDITDSGNKCCDQVKVIYDYFNEDDNSVKRIQIHYFTKEHNTTKKGNRYRLYKQVTEILPNQKTGPAEVMADFVEDLQISNVESSGLLYSGFDQNNKGIGENLPIDLKHIGYFSFGQISALDFAPDGLLYSGHEGSYSIGVYDVNSKKSVAGISSVERISALAFGSNKLLYTGYKGSNGGIKVYDVMKKKHVENISFGQISALAFGPNGLLYSGHEGGYYIGIYDINTKKNIGGFSVKERVSALAFGSDGLLYAGYKGGRGVYVYNVNNKQYLGKFSSDPVSALAFGSDGLLYSASEGSDYIVVHNVKSKNTIAYIRTGNRISALAHKSKKTGQESLVTINLTLRTKNQYGKDRQFIKKDYHGGNFKLDKTDKYKRDTFSTTVLVRNLAL